jgi:hypothetical protein
MFDHERRSLFAAEDDMAGTEFLGAECHDGGSDEIATDLRRRLCSSGYLALRTVECEYHDGTAVLRGHVPSFYLKQLAQSSLLSSPLVKAVVNLIEVYENIGRPFSLD